MNEQVDLLDQFSTSPTKEGLCFDLSPKKCSYRAPYFAYQTEGKAWIVTQGNCHHWDCPRCGMGRAKQEYGRIINGCRELSAQGKIAFITITCKGKGLKVKDAEANYLTWTNRFFDACRLRAKRSGQKWCYVQVTERQKRSHPHSHILTTYVPTDLYLALVPKFVSVGQGKRRPTQNLSLRSTFIGEQVIRSGLGSEYDISLVETVEGASRYVAKYLFKDSIFTTDWPPRWKRVRYSQSFPKLPERETNAIVLLSGDDWKNLAKVAATVTCGDLDTFEYAMWQLHDEMTIVRYKQEKKQ